MSKIYIAILTILIHTVLNGQQVEKKVFNAFKQGNAANCVSIALIKAAYSKYGFDNLFVSLKESRDAFQVTMRDFDTVSFTKEELDSVAKKASFILKDSTDFSIRLKAFAELCYAAMGTKLQSLNKLPTLDSAINLLNKGYETKDSNVLLGLKFKKLKPKRANKIKDLEHLVIYNRYHAVYASRGYYDECGNDSGIEKIQNLKWKRFGWKCCYKMCSISGAYMIID